MALVVVDSVGCCSKKEREREGEGERDPPLNARRLQKARDWKRDEEDKYFTYKQD